MAMLHSERLVNIVRITRFCANVCGADVFDANYRVNIRTAFVLTVIGSSFAFLAYTMIDGYAKEGDWTIIVQVLALAGGTLLQARQFLEGGNLWIFNFFGVLAGFLCFSNLHQKTGKSTFPSDRML